MIVLPQEYLEERYADWLMFHFGRIAEDTDPWRLEWEFHDPDRIAVSLFTRTLQNSGSDLRGYSDRQLAIGLDAIFNMGYGTLAGRLMARASSREASVAACQALNALYSDCLAARTPKVLAHTGHSDGNPLERFTYMLWEGSPLTSLASQSATRGVFLSVLESALYLDHPACVESALHGFGHIRNHGIGAAPRNAELDDIIDRFLAAREDLPWQLREYALLAKLGAIQ